jgi:hypothetical protein
MRGKLGPILEDSDLDAPAGALADVTLRRFWSHGPGPAKTRGERTDLGAQVIDLAAWKQGRGGAR